MVDQVVNYANGSYSTSDDGGRGDIFALVPRVYPVPDYLAEYYDLAKALRVATNTCVLQQGKCWVVRRDQTLPRFGQRCGRGECGWRSPNSPGFASELADLRSGKLSSVLGGVPVALATRKGLALVQDGAVVPLWQRSFVVGANDRVLMLGPSQTYSAAVRAAMMLAEQTHQQKLVYRLGVPGQNPTPMVYVQPGGLVRSAQPSRGPALTVSPMDEFELRQYITASAGGSLMPQGM